MSEMQVDRGGGRHDRVRVDYPSNSKKSKEPAQKKVEKVVSGPVVTKKRGWSGRLGQSFFSEDSNTVISFIVMEVLVPAAKNMISDAFSQGIDRVLFGDARPRNSGPRIGYTNYSSRYSDKAERRPELSRRARASHDFDDIILDTRGEAEDVLDRLRDLISQYEMATVEDLYDLVGLTSQFTDAKWGWYDLRDASVRAIRGGYLLSLPRTQPIT